MAPECKWCERAFKPRSTGGRTQLFCSKAHRRNLDRAGRNIIARLIESHLLTKNDLHRALLDDWDGTFEHLRGGP
jgi:hypothetical protein